MKILILVFCIVILFVSLVNIFIYVKRVRRKAAEEMSKRSEQEAGDKQGFER